MVPARPHARRLSPRPGKAPRALGNRTLGASSLVGPVAFAHHAMVGVLSPDQHLLTTGAEWAELEADIWQVSRLAVVGRNSAGHGGGPGVLPSVTVPAPMRVLLVPVLHPVGSRTAAASRAYHPNRPRALKANHEQLAVVLSVLGVLAAFAAAPIAFGYLRVTRELATWAQAQAAAARSTRRRPLSRPTRRARCSRPPTQPYVRGCHEEFQGSSE